MLRSERSPVVAEATGFKLPARTRFISLLRSSGDFFSHHRRIACRWLLLRSSGSTRLYSDITYGGWTRARTEDLSLQRRALYQLSYPPANGATDGI